MLKITFVILTLSIVFTNSVKVQNLGGKWLLNDAEGKHVNLEAKVPGGIYTDLMNNKIIDDIFFGYGDNATRWVPRSYWIYYRTFTVDDDLLKNENINIVFDGLDTFATVYINNDKVGDSQNMFAQYIFDIKKKLKSGDNKIEVRFQSPIEMGEHFFKLQEKSYNIPPDCVPDVYKGECHINMLRKMQASYSWDWGPSFPSVGIWKDLYIEAYNGSTIRYVVVDTVENDTSWVLNIDTYFASNVREAVAGTLTIQLALPNVNSTTIQILQKPNEYKEIVTTTSIEIPKSAVNTWWPNGYGSQELYNLSVTFSSKDDKEASTKNLRIGFRTIEIVEDALKTGLSFYFKVNKVPIFMKGSNLVPIDVLPEKGQDKSTITKLLTEVRNSHMNMLRVWGGGVYESDYFYELADELGILLWQDFAFASALYPTNEDYLKNVLDETRHQVKRLASHPSLALFSANNENEGNVASNYFHGKANATIYHNDYVILYIDTIRKEFERITHKRGLFTNSSPTNGKKSIEEGYLSKNVNDNLYGDIHYYNSNVDPFESRDHPIPRFCSEYGAQSLPSVATFLTATKNISDLNINGEFVKYRDHKKDGENEMKNLINKQLSLPDENSSNYYKVAIYYTQIIQAMWTKVASEHFRRYRSKLNDDGRGNTMGALYWMLNDVWVAPTWASIDYIGKLKMLQYYAADFFAPIIITGHKNSDRVLEIYIVSDLVSPVKNVTAFIQLYKWDSFTPISVSNVTLDLEAGKSHLIQHFNIDDYVTEHKCGETIEDSKHNCFIYLSLNEDKTQIAPNNFVFPAALKDCKLKVPNVKIESIKKFSNEEIYEVNISTDQIALFVWLDTLTIKGKFSENGFLLVAKTRKLYFYSEQNTTIEELLKDMTVTNLLDK